MGTFLLTLKSVTHLPLLIFINHQHFRIRNEWTMIRGKWIEPRKTSVINSVKDDGIM